MTTSDTYRRLEAILREMGSVVVAFSGGVDSALVLAVAHRVLGSERCLGVTSVSASLAPEEYLDAGCIAEQIGATWTAIETFELDDPGYQANGNDRCYYCKRELFTKLTDLAEERGYAVVVDGFNADDTGDWRPGERAGRERGVRSPLKEAGVAKREIRERSRELGLPTWEKQSFACLASRLPYGTEVTRERLDQVARAETVLRREGFRVFRVRYHGPTARLELGPDEYAVMADRLRAERIFADLRDIGFEHVVLDLQGFRSGSQNEARRGGDLLSIASESLALKRLGISDGRAVAEGPMVRLTLGGDELPSLWDETRRTAIIAAFREMGYTYVAADLMPADTPVKALTS